MKLFAVLTLLMVFNTACEKATSSAGGNQLQLVASFAIDVPEPSGLALSADGKSLWTVSDETGKVYQLDLQGAVLREIDVSGEDLEGVATASSNHLWLAEERQRVLLQVDFDGNVLLRRNVSVEQNELNAGLEGVTINSHNGNIYVVNERLPKVLLTLDKSGSVVSTRPIDYLKDLSGIDYDTTDSTLWLVSDESQQVVHCDLAGLKLEAYDINVKQAEGIAVNRADSLLYIVSDPAESLYVYRLH